jgi:large subunit ribosomal protein L19
MSKLPVVLDFDSQFLIERPDFNVGDTVEVYIRIIEGNKERLQMFAGYVIDKSGSGTGATFTVRRVSHNIGVERVFPLHSPRIAVIRKGQVRRAKLSYLRGASGKKARINEKMRSQDKSSK